MKIELTFLKILMLIRQVHQKSAIFFTIGIFVDKGFKFQPNICHGCHGALMISMNFTDIAILNIHGVDLLTVVLLAELAKVRP